MKKIILCLIITIANHSAIAQSTIFEDSFESYTNFAITNVGNWTLTDLDLFQTGNIINTNLEPYIYANSTGLKSFQVWNSSAVLPIPPETNSFLNYKSRTGAKSMICFYNYGDEGPPVIAPLNNDWMISPQMVLGTNNTVNFWAKACNNFYPQEKFNVWISNTNATVPGSFIKISPATPVTTPGINWVQYSYSIPSSYNNNSVFIAIQCVSENRTALLVDDFKVSGVVPCPAPFAGIANVNTSTLIANLSWTSSGSTNSQIVYQTQGTGTPSNISTTVNSVSGTSFTTVALLANTNYEFYVRKVCTAGTLYSVWAGPYLFNTIAAPACVTLVSPLNSATAINYTSSISLNWAVGTTGQPATFYDIYLDTNPNPTTLVGSVSNLSYIFSSGLAATTYYWKVVAKNESTATTICNLIFSFTTSANLFMPYCGPITLTESFGDVEPITYVNFAGINKTYSTLVIDAEFGILHKVFNDIALVARGSTYAISLNGNTASDEFSTFINTFTVFIDWNQNGILNDAGEVYFDNPLTINGNTGLANETSVTGSVVVPVTATLGNTRMRIKKQFGDATPILPCEGFAFGEIHDYVVNVSTNLATITSASTNFKSFPNPVKDVLNLSYDKNITSVSVINLLGQVIFTNNLNNQETKIDMSGLTTGAYMVKVTSDNEVKTIKVIKE